MNNINKAKANLERYLTAMDQVIEQELVEFNRRQFLGRAAGTAVGVGVLVSCKSVGSGTSSAVKEVVDNNAGVAWPYPKNSFLNDYRDLIGRMDIFAKQALLALDPNFQYQSPAGFDKVSPADLAWASEAENKIYASVRGKLVAKLVATWLAKDPYTMFEQLRLAPDEAIVIGGTFQPYIGPVIVSRYQHVIDGLKQHDALTVDRYGTEMGKTMKHPDHELRYFILGTDDRKKYQGDATFLKGKFDITGMQELAPGAVRRSDVRDIKKICEASVEKRIKKMLKNGDEIDVVHLARFVPVDIIREYFGIEIAPRSKTISYSEFKNPELGNQMKSQYYKIAGDLFDSKVMIGDFSQEKFVLPQGLKEIKYPATGEVVDWELEASSPDEARKTDFLMPDEEKFYHMLRYCFQNFFNNFAGDKQISLRSLKASFELLSLVGYRIDEEIAKRKDGSKGDDKTFASRLVALHLGDKSNELFSPQRIRENIFGTIVGAIINQEEQTCRVIDSLVDLGDPSYTAQAGRRSPFFNGEKYMQLLSVFKGNNQSTIDPEAEYANLFGYFNEALRHRPQGEVLLRLAKSDIKLGAGIKAGQVVFLGQGSAMWDTRHTELRDAIDFRTDRPADVYIHHGYGRHRCLGQFLSPMITIEIMRGILRRASGKITKTVPITFDRDGLYSTAFKVRVN